MSELYIVKIPYEFVGEQSGNKYAFNQATGLALQGPGIKAEQRGLVIPKNRRHKDEKPALEIITYPVEIDTQYASALFATCKQLQAQGYGPCDYALVSPLGIMAGQNKFFLPAEIIAEYADEIHVTLRLRTEHTNVFVNTLTGLVSAVTTERRLSVLFMEKSVLTVDSNGVVYSAKEEVLEVTVEEVITQMQTALNKGDACKICGNTIFPKPYRQSPSIKMYENVIQELSACISQTSKYSGSW